MIKALSEPKPKIRINKNKLKELRENFDELRHKFFKTEIKEYRKAFYNIKNYINLSESETKQINIKFHGNIESIDYDDLDNYDDN